MFSSARNWYADEKRCGDTGLEQEDTMSKNLVDLMAKRLERCNEQMSTDKRICEQLLTLVKEHIGEVAERCPECEGSGNLHKPNQGQLAYYSCLKCKGTGVIARTEGDV